MIAIAILLACIVFARCIEPIQIDWDSYPDNEEGPP